MSPNVKLSKCAVLMAFALVVVPVVFAINGPAQQTNSVVLQAGMALLVRLSNTISTATAKVGNLFAATGDVAVTRNDQVVIPAGTRAQVRVLEVEPGSHSGRPARLSLEVVNLTFPDGRGVNVATNPLTKIGEVCSMQLPTSQVTSALPGRMAALRSLATTGAVTVSSRPVANDIVVGSGRPLQFVVTATVAVKG
jgi:hypothetical protein